MSQLSLDDVVALNALIVTAIGLMLAFGRKDRKAPTLNLTGPRRTTAVDELNVRRTSNLPVAAVRRERAHQSYGTAALKRLEEDPLETSNALGTSRQLNVFFNWNGHTWDAYEVLGVPAGASRDSVIQAFHAARAKSPDSTAFVQAATDAILKR